MKSEEIDLLEAGRDADALLAELIPLPGVRLERVAWHPGKQEPYWRYVGGGFREKFRPTSDPAAAALVLEWLRGRPDSIKPQAAKWVAKGSELAICKAALLTLAGEPCPPQDVAYQRPAQQLHPLWAFIGERAPLSASSAIDSD
jgi:hypothetical protein